MTRRPTPTSDPSRAFWDACLTATALGRPLHGDWDAAALDWKRLLAAAQAHRVVESFKTLWEAIPDLPADVADELWVARQMAVAQGRVITDAIEDLRSVGRETGIRMAILKSPVYLFDAFKDFGERAVRDVDILAAQPEFPALCRALVERGYRMATQRYGAVLTGRSAQIDVRFVATNRRRFFRLLPARMLLDSAAIHPRFDPLLCLSPPDDAVVLVLHAFHHAYREALWLRDLVAWWRVRNPDPQAVFRAFDRLGLTRTAWVAWMAMTRMGWTMPGAWTAQMWHVSGRFQRLVDRYWQRLDPFGRDDTVADVLFRRRLEWAQARGIEAKCRVLSPCFSWRNLSELHKLWRQGKQKTIEDPC